MQYRPGSRPGYGGGLAADTEVVSDAIRAAALCVVCLARKVGAAPMSIISSLASIGQSMKVTSQRAPCDGCSLETTIYRIR